MATKKSKKKPQTPATLAEAPDLRDAFKEVSAQMAADFKRTAATGHPGGKGSNREAIVRTFLTQYLPRRYGIGTGQLIHWDNLRSRQCDVVIYDRNNTPRLMPDERHSLFPVEAVFAIVEVKSKLTSAELSDAMASLQSAYRVARDPSPWGASGQWTDAERQTGPFCSVFAFSSDRSIDAVREQVIREWRSNAGRVQQPPPLIVILGDGVVGPRGSLSLVEPLNDYTFIRRTKELSLLRFYMHLMGELSADAPSRISL